MTTRLDDAFAAAVRDLLVEHVKEAGSSSQRSARPRQWIAAAGAVLALAAAGGGIAYATGAFSTPPGGDAVTKLAPPVTTTGTGTQTVDLGTPPAGTTAIDIAFTCLTAGHFTFTDGATVQCSSADAARRSPIAAYTLSIAPGQVRTTIAATPGSRWRLVATYASVTTTAWGVNASGQTYGVQNQHGIPDLVAVIATNHRSGYVYANKLYPRPKTIAQALAQNNAPSSALTVYESDGKTPIGKFVVGANPRQAGSPTRGMRK
ncbi:MAG: peptidase M56 family protein [Solirubrobacteraceae bacterium]